MKMYNGSEHRATETYMISGTSSNQHLTLTPSPQEIDSMGNEVVPEFIVDQGVYYPATAANYYGYYTGFEPLGEWNDHQRFFGLDGHDLQYAGMQTESQPIVYYTPSYGYAHSPYNPYNPYIPGAVIGVDSPFVGTQQYFTNAAYQQPGSSAAPAYYPVVVQPGSDIISDGSSDRSLSYTNTSSASRPGTAGVEYTPQFTLVGPAVTVQRADYANLSAEASQNIAHKNHSSRLPEGLQLNVAPSKQQPLSHGFMPCGNTPQVTQDRNAHGSMQLPDQFPPGSVSSHRGPLKVTVPTHNGFTDFGSSVHEKATVDKLKPRLQFGGTLNNGNGISDLLGEQNRGPRSSRSRSQWTSSIAVKAYTTKAGASNAQGNIIIYPDQYNQEDFPVNYPDAKFFVIKSYSEDDVHKSVKYNVWSSTPSGNKRLDSAYEEAQRISGGSPRKCPVFLFFSVNASGQFCGVAEMIGPVDFHKDMDFWQQDKWTGSFPVKWHIIKDVPNTSFRHIILENNENKPVTNSRDTQEIRYIPGTSMLNIFKSSPMRTSILDDLMYYEERQRIMHEEKSRLLGRSYDAAPFVPGFVPPNRPTVTIKQPLKIDEKPRDDVDLRISAVPIPGDDQVTTNFANASKSTDKKDVEPKLTQDAVDMGSVMKIGSLSISANGSHTDHSTTVTASTVPANVVTVGSVPIKVNGYGESTAGVLTVGTIAIDPKAVKQSTPSG